MLSSSSLPKAATSEPQFLRSMGVLLGPPLIGDNRVETLINGDEIFPSMLQAIQGARLSIPRRTSLRRYRPALR
jgi:cardiolipin synthase